MRAPFLLALLLGLVVACGSPAAPAATEQGAAQESPAAEAAGGELFPDVVDATATRSGAATVSVSATMSSPYDTPDRYADAFRVRTEQGQVLGVNELTHDHADEQPFTRTLAGVEVPPGVERVVVEGRDMVSGWGGATVTVDLPR